MFRFWFNDQLVFQIPLAVVVLSAFIVWALYNYGVKKWIPLWLQITWARICGWQVVQGDVHEQMFVAPYDKLWVMGNVYYGDARPATIVSELGSQVFISGDLIPTDGNAGPKIVFCGSGSTAEHGAPGETHISGGPPRSA